MWNAMNQIHTPRAAARQWLAPEGKGRNVPSLPRRARSARELRGHRTDQHHKNMISMSLTCDGNLCYTALLICLSCLLRCFTLWEILDRCSAPRVNQTSGDVSLLSWDTHLSPAKPTQRLHSHLSADPHFDHGTVRTFQLSPPLCVPFAVSWLYVLYLRMGMHIPCLNPRTWAGKVTMGPGPHSALETPLLCSSEMLIPKNSGALAGGKGDFCCFTGLCCFLNCTKPHSQTHTGLCLGKGKNQSPSQR